jgi:hypothetical protein
MISAVIDDSRRAAQIDVQAETVNNHKDVRRIVVAVEYDAGFWGDEGKAVGLEHRRLCCLRWRSVECFGAYCLLPAAGLGVFRAAIDFRVALLTSVAPYLGDGQPLNANFGESVAGLVELERPDDGSDELHDGDVIRKAGIEPE